eukprot:CAMPEP_0184385802 /NCGR_PEP_ID=MMETSP0007-20130409/9174_1 /TAXON_ID=97485 /ORGANISM="Prymnesium parvum, Strain Texoma1" /LENGTH=108 /DNA_ID=CAMNT_0026733333 /DNA_START=421 /DNA_END=744 /DNA_ORIENTATION=-
MSAAPHAAARAARQPDHMGQLKPRGYAPHRFDEERDANVAIGLGIHWHGDVPVEPKLDELLRCGQQEPVEVAAIAFEVVLMGQNDLHVVVKRLPHLPRQRAPVIAGEG